MGGRATSLTIGLAAPADLPAQWALDFADGFADECALVGASVVGGDLTRSDQIVIAVTVLGACTQSPVLRSGARAGDVLALAGRQGWAAGGLAVLGRGFRSPRVLVDAYRRPEPPYDAGPAAADAGATAMIDVSDGLLADAGHLAADSGVAIDVRRSRVRGPRAAGRRRRRDRRRPAAASSWAAATTTRCWPRSRTRRSVPEGWTVIGEVLDGEPGSVTVDGAAYDGPTGWTHF